MIVMKTARALNSTARLITTSMSKSRYRSTDTPIASGINAKDTITRFCTHVSQLGSPSPPQELPSDANIAPE